MSGQSNPSGDARPLNIVQRPDLQAVRQVESDGVWWLVKDPIALTYHRLREEEYALLSMLDGRVSLAELKRRFEAQFPPQLLDPGQLSHFLGSLHRAGLIVSDAAEQGDQRLERMQRMRRRERWARLASVLCIRFRGIDPERFLRWAYPAVRWIFTTWAMTGAALLLVAALLMVAIRWNAFTARLPSFGEFFTPGNLVWLFVVLGGIKVLHELGHAFACKHFGGECHEMGLMFLVFTPCLYCNTTDAWMLARRWPRVAIDAAGIVVEVVLAAVCTFVWWFTPPGLVNDLCLKVMIVASVGTLVFNGNPLMRYDGYYVLSDSLNIPNLAQKSASILRGWLARVLLGWRDEPDPLQPTRHRWALGLYAAASAAYRWLVMLSILIFLTALARQYGVPILGRLIGLVAVAGLFVQPVWRLIAFLRRPRGVARGSPVRVAWTACGLALVAAAAVFVPLPRRVHATFELEPRNAQRVYVEAPGRLVEVSMQPGQRVDAGELIARLENIDAEIQAAAMTSRRNEMQSRLENLERQRFADPTAALDIPATAESLAALEAEARQRRQDIERLAVRAPVAGTILAVPSMAPRPRQESELAAWSGTPFETRNLGCRLEAGTMLCQVGDPRQWQAVLVVDQSDVPRVAVGQEVKLRLDSAPGRTFVTRVAEVARVDLAVSPRSLSNKAGGDLPTVTDAAGVERPMTPSYQVLAPLDDAGRAFASGMRGQAKVHVAAEPLAPRVWRWFSRTFHFRLQ